MEWVQIAAPSVEEATQRALEELGVAADEAEIEILEEPRAGLFGRIRGEARVRARIAPRQPRAKVERRRGRGEGESSGGERRPRGDRDRSRGRGGKGRSGGSGGNGNGAKATDAPAREPKPPRTPKAPAATPPVTVAPAADARPASTNRPTTADPTIAEPAAPQAPPDTTDRSTDQGVPMTDITLDEQEPVALAFLDGLLDAFDVEAELELVDAEDEALEIHVMGDADELGLLIGPRGATLASLQELLRTAVAQQLNGRLVGRLRLDVAGYRERRSEALRRFATQVAEKVLASGESVAMEPMSPPDRKVVHDTINDIEGVVTESQGEDHRRRVVVKPA